MYILNAELTDAIAFVNARQQLKLVVTPSIPPLVTVFDGKHTRTQKLGKLLATTFNPSEVKDLVEMYKEINGDLSAYDVCYTRNYVEAYKHEVYAIDSTCRSCMTGSDSVRVYNGDDRISLLTVYRKGSSSLIGRTLVRSDKMEYVRLYIDHNFIKTPVMKAIVTREGYEQGNLLGCTLDLIEEDGNVVCPYLDRESGFDIDYYNQKLILTSHGEFCGSTTDGYVQITPICMCEHCGDSFDEDDMYFVEAANGMVCEHCLDSNYVNCDGEWYSHDDCTVNESTGEYIPTDCLDKYDVSFTDNGTCYNSDEVVCVDDVYYHINEVEQLVIQDEDGNDYVHETDAIHVKGSDTLETGYYTRPQIQAQLEELQDTLDALQTDLFDEKIEVELTKDEVNQLILEINLLEKL